MSNSSLTHRRAERGLTLSEILLVLALIGLLVGIALPNFVRVRRVSRVTSAANNVYVGLMKVRQIALRHSKPMLVKVNASATSMQFTACMDSNYLVGSPAVPGADSTTTVACTGGDLPMGAAGSFKANENPFGQNGSLTLSLAQNGISFGYPAASGSTYTATPTNFPVPTGVNWFEFDPSGKLRPNGAAPQATLDYTFLPRFPANASIAPGGPEFYIAEENAADHNATPRSHVYRKVSLTGIGGVTIEIWVVNGAGGFWTGVR